MRRVGALLSLLAVAVLVIAALWLAASDSETAVDWRDRLSLGDHDADETLASGFVEAPTAVVASELGGTVRSILVAEGDAVEAGALLAEMTTPGLDEELTRAKESVAAARGRADKARLAPAIPDRRLVESALALAEAHLARLEAQRDALRLVAPISGTVSALTAAEGQFVPPGRKLMAIASLETVELFVYVAETDVGRLEVGAKAEVTVDAYEDETFDGEVVSISSQAEFTPRTVQSESDRADLVYAVRIEVPNPAGKLKAGMPADARLELASD